MSARRACRAGTGHERIERTREDVGGEAGPPIANGDPDGLGGRRRGHDERDVLRMTVCPRVREQVVERPAEQRRIDRHADVLVDPVSDDAHQARRLGRRALLEPGAKLDRLAAHVRQACSRRGEEIAEDRVHLDELAIDVVERTRNGRRSKRRRRRPLHVVRRDDARPLARDLERHPGTPER